MVLASRWGHGLSWLKRSGASPDGLDRPVDGSEQTHAIVIASEPTSSEAWTELPERTLLCVTPDLETQILPLDGEASRPA
jgi:predicted glutamine amidotransferase